MDTSSPLAAMRPAPPPFGQADLFGSHHRSHLAPSNPLEAGSLNNLRDHFGFQRPNADFFNVKSVRGSSPTTSLAADLSQNFRINDARWVVGDCESAVF